MQFLHTWESDDGTSTVTFCSPRKTEDIYTLMVEIVGDDTIEDMNRLILFAQWCAQFTDYTAEVLIRDLGVDVIDLSTAIALTAGLSKSHLGEVRRLWDIGTGADNYDPKLDPKSCDCPKCRGDADESSICKFNGTTDRGFLTSQWAFLAENPQYLSSPYSVYQLAKEMALARSEGLASDRQSRELEARKKEEAKAIREKHGHSW